MSLEEVKSKVLRPVARIYDLDIPGVRNLEKYMNDMSDEEVKDFRKMVADRAISDLFPETAKSITDKKTRVDLQAKTQSKISPKCPVCVSIFGIVYNEWLTENKTFEECRRSANIAFNEKISSSSFSNHKNNHMFKINLVRRLMILQNPTADHEKVAKGLLQIVSEEIAMEPEGVNLKKVRSARDLIKVIDDIEKTRSKAPIVDARQVTLNQLNISGNIPVSRDTKELLDASWTDEDEEKLGLLTAKWKDKGSALMNSHIPGEVPEVEREKNEVIGEIIEIEEDI
jgi:hypothetical protein